MDEYSSGLWLYPAFNSRAYWSQEDKSHETESEYLIKPLKHGIKIMPIGETLWCKRCKYQPQGKKIYIVYQWFQVIKIGISYLAIKRESWYALLIINLCVRLSSFDAVFIASTMDSSDRAGGSWLTILNSASLTCRLSAIARADWWVFAITMFRLSSSISRVSKTNQNRRHILFTLE